MSYLSPEQVDALLRPIKPHRVSQDNKGLSHVEAYEIRAHLNRLFGFGRWSADTLAMELVDARFATITKDGKQKDVVTVGYRAQVRLAVCAPDGVTLATYTEWATGDAPNFPAFQWPDAHDFAIKTAESQALKRCAMNLGDQFGLSLYRKGSTDALVAVTLVGNGDGAKSPDVQDDAPVVPVTNRRPDVPPDAEEQIAAALSTPDVPPKSAFAAAAAPEIGLTAHKLREMILAADSAPAVTHTLGLAARAGLADETVADENGEACTITDLAIKRRKALR